jgi:hypothetical protein
MMRRWGSSSCGVSRLGAALSLLVCSFAIGCASTTPAAPPAATAGTSAAALGAAPPPGGPRGGAPAGETAVAVGEAAAAAPAETTPAGPERATSAAAPAQGEAARPAAEGAATEGAAPAARPPATEEPAPERRAAEKAPTPASLRGSASRPRGSARPARDPDEVAAPRAPTTRAAPAVAAKALDAPPPSGRAAAASCGQVPAGVPALLLDNDRDGTGGSLRGKLAEGASATHVLAVCSVGNLELVAPLGFRIESDAPGLSSAKAKAFVTGAAGLQWELPVTPGKLVKFKVIRGEGAPESYRVSYYLYPR